LDPDKAVAWSHRALAKLKLGNLEAAIADCNQALRHDRRIPEIWSTRGGAKLGLEDIKGAMEDCTEALKLDPRNAAALSCRGEARTHTAEEAEELWAARGDTSAALEIEPPNVLHHITTWTHSCVYETVRPEQVQEELEVATLGDKREDLHARIERLIKAMADADGVKSVKPESIDAARAKLKRWQKVAAEALKLRDPDEEASKRAAAKRLAEIGEVAAVPLLRKALTEERNAHVRHSIVEALGMLGDHTVLPVLERMIKVAQKDKDKESKERAQLAILEVNCDSEGISTMMRLAKPQWYLRADAEKTLARVQKKQEAAAA